MTPASAFPAARATDGVGAIPPKNTSAPPEMRPESIASERVFLLVLESVASTTRFASLATAAPTRGPKDKSS